MRPLCNVSSCIFLHLSIPLSIHLPICLSTYLSIYLSICLFICLSVYISVIYKYFCSNHVIFNYFGLDETVLVGCQAGICAARTYWNQHRLNSPNP